MARTTGYTATAAARMLIEGLYKEPGIAPPELIGRHKEPCDFMLRHLRERQVVCEEEVTGSPVKTLDRRFAGESKQESR
jgi:saccharopine dehydrogenase-like NADP-dependent oxidoreductase